jgi:hypothetical protein
MKKKNYSFLLVMAFILVTAVFLSPTVSAQDPVEINITIIGQGIVDVSPEQLEYYEGDTISLEANQIPDSGYQFSNWSGDINSSTAKIVDYVLTGDLNVTATFETIAPTCFMLSTQVPAGGGTINRSRPGDDGCPEGAYLKDSTVLLTAQPSAGYDFTRWTIGPEMTQDTVNPLNLVMDKARTVTAEFNKGCRQLKLSRVPPEGGQPTTVSPLQSDGCLASYYKLGEQITLTANPFEDEGWKFIGWTKQIDGGAIESIPPAAPPNEKKYSFQMPGVTTSLSVGINFKKKATYGFGTATQEVQENAGTVNITVVWDKSTLPAAPTVRVKTADGTAEAGKDYVAKNITRSFTANQEKISIAVEILDDSKAEGDETFFVDLSFEGDDSELLLGISRVTVTILDDEVGKPTIRFENPPYQVDESTSSIMVPVSVYPLPAGVDEVFVNFYTEDGTAAAGQDYEGVSNRTLRIPIIGQEAKTTTLIKISQDNLDEADETILLALSDPYPPNKNIQVGAPATLTILDDDDSPAVGFSESEYFIKQESRISASVPILLSEVSGQEIKIDYAITLERTGGTSEGIMSIPAGSTGTALEVDIASAVPGDVFSLQLRNPQNAELGLINSARLYVLDTDIEDCHTLTLTFSGYGQAPTTTTKTSSLGCPIGQFVSGELIEITAQPQLGWYVSAWYGTIDDESSSLQNAVQMPNKDLSVNADYRVPIFFSVVGSPPDQWSGPEEEEPNNLFSQANGPLQFARDYFGGFPVDSDKEDRYYFELDAASNVMITLRDIPKGTDYDIYLYPEDWSKGEIASSREFDNRPEEIKESLGAGKYYIRVLAGSSKSSSEKYRLRVEIN